MTAWSIEFSAATPQEQDAVSNLSAMSGLEHDVALRVLRKHNGNVEKAADAILAGDVGEVDAVPVVTVAPSDTVIDLTGDDHDDEMKRALQMSMETENQTNFGPSTRAPDPNWAVVPSNVQTQRSHEDESMRQAIEASLALPEEEDKLPLDELPRQGGRPVALRPQSANIAYAALVLHALLHVPQVREKVSQYRPPNGYDPNSEVGMMMRISETLTNMELAEIAVIVDDSVLECLKAKPAIMSDPPGEQSIEFFKSIATLIDNCLETQGSQENQETPSLSLFSFTSAQIELRPDTSPNPVFNQNNFVIVETGGNDYSCPNELLARLSNDLTRYEGGGSTHNVLARPSEVVTFNLKNLDRVLSTTSTPDAFVYPKSIYMDQFMLENLNIANEKRAQQKNIQAKVTELEKTKMNLSKSDGQDVCKNLKATIDYYEHIAKADTAERRLIVETATKKFKATLAGIEAKLEEIDIQMSALQTELNTIFDCPELQNHCYDLRAVLIHTGIPGRKQFYSYFQDRDGIWWKTVDYAVTEVSEEVVLTDATGLHLNAGPYMLMYSRSLTQEQLHAPISWYEPYFEAVKQNNEKLLASFPTELLAKSNISEESMSKLSSSEASMRVIEKREDVSMLDIINH